MNIPSLKFPQITRLFSASIVTALLFWTERTVLWGLFAGLLYINATMLVRANTTTAMFLPALIEPFSPDPHMRIASMLWDTGFHAQAKEEITLAQELTPNGKTAVLGADTSPSVILDRWESQPKKLEDNYMFWKTILEKNPDYRDAFIQAGIFAYELGKTDEAFVLLQKAYDLDPNFQATRTLLSKIQ